MEVDDKVNLMVFPLFFLKDSSALDFITGLAGLIESIVPWAIIIVAAGCAEVIFCPKHRLNMTIKLNTAIVAFFMNFPF